MGPVRGSVLTFGSQALIAVLTFASTVVIGRVLGPASRGAVAVALLTPILFASLGSLGLGTATTYFVAREPGRLPAIVGTGFGLAAGLGAVTLATFAGASALGLLPSTSGIDATALLALVAIVPAFLLHELLANALRGRNRLVAWNAMYLLQAGSNVAILLALAALGRLSIPAALAGAAVSYTIPVGFGYAALRRAGLGRLRFERALVPVILRYGLRTHLASVVFLLTYRLDSLLLQGLAGNYQAGIYATAVAPSEAIWMIGGAISAVAFPHLSALSRSGQDAAARSLLGRTFALSLAVTALAATLGPWFIVLAYGEAFRASIVPFYLLLPGTLAFSIVKLLWVYFASRDQALHVALVVGGATALDAIANVFLAPHFGATGSAIAASVSYVLASAGLLLLFAPPREWPAALASGLEDWKRARAALAARSALPQRRR